MEAGRVVDVGRLSGEFAGADPAGRYLAIRHDEVLAVHDVRDALAVVASFPVGDRVFDHLQVHPDGTAVAAPTDVRWLQYSADGSHLYVGDESGRLGLLDPVTLERLDTISAADTWGDDAMSCCAPAPSTAVAFAANLGDDLVAFGVADVGPTCFSDRWVDIPGERAEALAFLAEDELVVLDSDDRLTRVRWKDRPMTVSALCRGEDLLGDGNLMLSGPMFVRGGLLVIPVERETGSRWDTVALAVLDLGTPGEHALLPLPGADETQVVNGTICRRIGSQTLVSRWVPAVLRSCTESTG